MAHLELDRIVQRYGAHTVVDGVGFRVDTGGIACLLGPSGCGKTTLMRMLAGFEQPTEGRILLDGKDLSGIPPYKRPVNMMFQSYALFPHMTVEENIALVMKVAQYPKEQIHDRVTAMLKMVNLYLQLLIWLQFLLKL